MKFSWKNPKKYLWPLNAITFNFYRLIPNRDKKLWIFGAWEGWKYDDNSRALFEYVNEKYGKDIRCVWLTNEQKTADVVKSLGYEAYTSESPIGKKMQKSAGAAIYTNGVMDFGLHPKVAGSLIVSLWHGVGFKKIYNAKYSGVKLYVKRIMDIFFSWTYRDLSLVPSNYVAWQCRDYFSLSRKAKIRITGQPRNDILKKNLTKEDVLSKIGVDYQKKIILYMPTYRGYAVQSHSMTKIIQDLYESRELHEFLTQHGYIFVAKLHPLTPIVDLEKRDDFLILDYYSIDSTQEILGIADILVTDYSSVFVDYALLERPVVFYMPDHEEFLKQDEPIYDDFYKICNLNRCDNPIELSKKLSESSMIAVNAINELFEDSSIRNTCYSENVFQAIIKELKIHRESK